MLLQDVDRVVLAETVVNVGVDQAWDAWTTNDGIRSFLAPGSNVELRIDGPYQIFFDPDAEPGLKGTDDMIVLAFQLGKMLSFTWNAPTLFPNVRPHRTHVVVRFFSEGEERTRVTLRHDGWGEGEEWDRAFDYFTRAWQQVVMPWLKYRFDHGPLDWDNLPRLDEG